MGKYLDETGLNRLWAKIKSLVSDATVVTKGDGKSSIQSINSYEDGALYAEGGTASGDFAVALGMETEATGESAFALGMGTEATGESAFAAGWCSVASASESHAEGSFTTASGSDSHAEGNHTVASGPASHAEGDATKATGYFSHSEGNNTEAKAPFSHVEGTCNKPTSLSIHSVGIGDIEESVQKSAEEIYHPTYYDDNTGSYKPQTDTKDGYKYLIGIGGFDGTNFEKDSALNPDIKSVQEVINEATTKLDSIAAIPTSEIEALEL